MATKPLTASEFYEIYKAEAIARGTEILDFNAGSMQDINVGALTTCLNEVTELTINEFLKTYFSSASGKTDTNPNDDLQYLAVDHFGTRFARPEETQSTVTEKLSRPNTDAGDVLIDDTVIVKTGKDSNGEEVRFKVDSPVTMTGLTVNVQCTSVEAGAKTNVLAGKISVLESALTDPSITVVNEGDSVGGSDAQEDEEYRKTISNLIEALAGATEAAIKGAVEAVPQITYVSVITILVKVREVDDLGDPIGATFKIPFVRVYVADAAGNYTPALITLAEDAIYPVRAAGVKITVLGAQSTAVNWTAVIALNPAGPNFAALSEDTTPIKEDMANYIDNILDIGDGFNRSNANAYILSIWGPSGTGDLTSFATTVPTGNVAGADGVKLVSGDMVI